MSHNNFNMCKGHNNPLWSEIYSAIAHGVAGTDAEVDDITTATDNVYNYIRSGCRCGTEHTGETSFMLCNICGLDAEKRVKAAQKRVA